MTQKMLLSAIALAPFICSTAFSAAAQTQPLPQIVRDSGTQDLEKETLERQQIEKEFERERSQILAIAIAILNESRETQEIIEKVRRQTDFQDSLQTESLARKVLVHRGNATKSIDISELNSLMNLQRLKDQSTAIYLYKRVRDSMDQASNVYREYKRMIHRVYLKTNRLSLLEKMTREAKPNANCEKSSELDYCLKKARVDLQELTVQCATARQTIVDLAGNRIAAEVDKQLVVSCQTRRSH